MRIAILITTYYRPDNRSYFYLDRALNSVRDQSHKDYQVYLIGDDYTNKGQFQKIAKKFNVKSLNLPESIERGKYKFGTYPLFCAGGLTPALKGIEMAMTDDYEYVCHLDHDDWWEYNHLEYINEVIERHRPLFICTLSTYFGAILPSYEPSNEVIQYITYPGCCSLSASCIRYSETKTRFRDVFAETGKAYPADADFWTRIADEVKLKGGYMITSVTCHHDQEAYSLKAK
jgi:glycosyltransferase involved in cell wall biosynthesis